MINYIDPNFNDSPGQRKLPTAYKVDISAGNRPIDVSILTPYYNTDDVFVETLVSVLAQSMQNWEWVIVDDGSTDAASLARLATLTKNDIRIRVIRQENAGPAAARNKAFENSRGRYVCLLDSDDMIEHTYIEKCMWFLDSNLDFSFCNSYSCIFGEQEYLWTVGFERNKDHLQANSGPLNTLIRRKAYEEIGGFDTSIKFGHEDWDFWLAMANAGHWGYTIPEFLQWYRKRGGGRFEQIMSAGDVNEKFEKLMREKYSGLEKRFPNPQRRSPQPYETIETEWRSNNQLASNPNGRRIMFVVPWMVVGGADRVNLDLIEGLVKKGHEVTVCATLLADHRWEHKFADLTPDVFVLPNFLPQKDFPRFLAYLIESRQIDTVVVANSTIGYQLLPFLRAAAPKTAFIDLSHVEELHWMNGGHPRFAAGYQDALDLNVVTTRNVVKWMETRGADPAQIRVLYTGVRPPVLDRKGDDRKVIRARFGIADEIPVIVFAGRICKQKRPELLAEVLREARDAGISFQALIIGDGELRPMFESLVTKYDLGSCVQMVGSIPHEKWLEVLVGADILLMPSQYEGISVALLESMAAGVVPVVACVGGQEEVVSESAGYLISHGEGELQEYLRALRKLTDSSGELEAKSKACQTLMATKYSWEKTIQDFEQILAEAHEAIKDRRCQFSIAIGRELASLALENKRLGDAVDWLWNNPRAGQPTQALATNVAPVVRLADLLGQTRLGRSLLGNTLVRNFRRILVARLQGYK